jgi:NAD(P)-dependent dehydrogenase (short-subunit alcohol dehydrogenase family)
MIIVIGSSSKLCLELAKETNVFFIGRSNPFKLKTWHQGGDLSSKYGIEKTQLVLNGLIIETKETKIDLVLLNGVSSYNWEESINVNMLATALIGEQFAKQIKELDKHGSITVIGTASSYLGGKLPYSMTKASLIGFINTINHRFSPNIRANMILPGAFESGMTEDWSEEKKQIISKNLNAKRLATIREVVDSILFCINNQYLSEVILNMTSGSIKT